MVAVHPLEELGKQGFTAADPSRNLQAGQVAGGKAQRLQRGDALLVGHGSCRQRLGVALYRVSAEVERIHLAQPGVLVGGEHAERGAALGQQFIPLEDAVVLEAVPGAAPGLQRGMHLGVPHEGLGLVVMVGKHRLNAQCLGQRRDGGARGIVQHDQPGLAVRLGGRQVTQPPIQLLHAGVDEVHPPVAAGQGVQNLLVEDKHAPHLPALAQRVVERRMVVCPQVAAEPDQTRFKVCFHASTILDMCPPHSRNTAELAMPGRWCCPRRGGGRSDTQCAKPGGVSSCP